MEFVSAGCFELTGYQPEEILNNKQVSYADSINQEDRQRVWMVIQAALLHRQTFRLIYRINTAQGDEKWVWEQGTGIYAPDGSIEAVEGFISDITHRKDAEEQLRNSEMRFRRIYESAPIGIAMSDSGFHFISANEAFCQMMGYSEDELKVLTFKELTHPDFIAADIGCINDLSAGRIQNYKAEKCYIRKDGQILWGALVVSVIRDLQGKFLYYLCMIKDMTERKNSEIELTRINQRLTQQDRIKNEFVSTVSHELRTPLCVFKNIISNAMAGVNGPISSKLRKSFEMANQNVDRLSRIVNDFLDIAKIEAGKMHLALTNMNVTSVITDVIDEFAPVLKSKHVTIDKLVPKDVIIQADRDKLIQILTNLVGNANKFIQPGGHILVTLSDQEDLISISVHDDGPGIAPEKVAKIFDRFALGADAARNCQPSTGLGLSISKELVELHNGRIWAQSVCGQGSTFTFVLPKKQNCKA